MRALGRPSTEESRSRKIAEKRVIDAYLESPQDPYDTIAEKSGVRRTLVRGIISRYYDDLTIKKPLYFCYSIGCPKYIGYLFDCYSEREVIINNNRQIENREEFTQHQLNFLKINYGLQ